MIFEADEGYLRKNTLPRLVSEYLKSGGEDAYDVSVSWANSQPWSGRLVHQAIRPKELLARVKYQFGEVMVDFARREVLFAASL